MYISFILGMIRYPLSSLDTLNNYNTIVQGEMHLQNLGRDVKTKYVKETIAFGELSVISSIKECQIFYIK